MKISPETLLRKAASAGEKAHSAYSNFRVGAALLTDDGEVMTGCNIENASYGLTVCAERVAIFSAVAAGYRAFSAMAVVSDSGAPPLPCGACLQVMTEFCGPDFQIYTATAKQLDRAQERRLSDLLPEPFNLTTRDHAAMP